MWEAHAGALSDVVEAPRDEKTPLPQLIAVPADEDAGAVGPSSGHGRGRRKTSPERCHALEPHVDARTMEIHHTRHHQGYVDKLNAAAAGHDLGDPTVEQLGNERAAGHGRSRRLKADRLGGVVLYPAFLRLRHPNATPIPASSDQMIRVEGSGIG